jgi:hypothetical protein
MKKYEGKRNSFLRTILAVEHHHLFFGKGCEKNRPFPAVCDRPLRNSSPNFRIKKLKETRNFPSMFFRLPLLHYQLLNTVKRYSYYGDSQKPGEPFYSTFDNAKFSSEKIDTMIGVSAWEACIN